MTAPKPEPQAREAIVEALRAEAAGGAPTGLLAAEHDRALTIAHRYLLLHTLPD